MRFAIFAAIFYYYTFYRFLTFFKKKKKIRHSNASITNENQGPNYGNQVDTLIFRCSAGCARRRAMESIKRYRNRHLGQSFRSTIDHDLDITTFKSRCCSVLCIHRNMRHSFLFANLFLPFTHIAFFEKRLEKSLIIITKFRLAYIVIIFIKYYQGYNNTMTNFLITIREIK